MRTLVKNRIVLAAIGFSIYVLFGMASKTYAGYSFYRAVNATTSATAIPQSLSNFPALINVTISSLKSTGNGGNVQNSSGTDIAVFSDSGCTSQIQFERERYTSSTGEFVAHVAQATMNTSTVDYLCYGNAAQTSDLSSSTAPWDSNYKGVWHLPNGTTLTANDSTVNAKNGTLTNSPTAVTGQIDGAANFVSSTSQYITMGNNLNTATNTFTLETWFNVANANQYATMLSKRENAGSFIQYQVGVGSIDSGGGAVSAKTLYSFFYDGTGAPQFQGYHTTNNIADGNWHHAVWTKNGSTSLIYVDGVNQSLTTDSAGTSVDMTNTGNFNLGFQNGTAYYDGKLDESRVSVGIIRSANWIATDYWNSYATGTAGFWTVGAETSLSSGGRVGVTYSSAKSTLSFNKATVIFQ